MTADVLPSPVQRGVQSGSFTVHNLANGEMNKSVRLPDQPPSKARASCRQLTQQFVSEFTCAVDLNITKPGDRGCR